MASVLGVGLILAVSVSYYVSVSLQSKVNIPDKDGYGEGTKYIRVVDDQKQTNLKEKVIGKLCSLANKLKLDKVCDMLKSIDLAQSYFISQLYKVYKFALNMAKNVAGVVKDNLMVMASKIKNVMLFLKNKIF